MIGQRANVASSSLAYSSAMLNLTAEQSLKAEIRIAGGMREVGTLLIAFAPLDYTMREAGDPWTLAGFLVAGGVLFGLSVLWEVTEHT